MPTYKDNALNRCLKRVGKTWGGGKGKTTHKMKDGTTHTGKKHTKASKKVFSDDVSDVKGKAPTIKKGTKITKTFGEKIKKARKKGVSRVKMVGKSAPAYDKGEKAVLGRGNTKRSGRGQKGKEKGGLGKSYLETAKKQTYKHSFTPTLGKIDERMRKERKDKGKKRGKKGAMKYEHL